MYVTLLVALLFLCSRGLFELVVGKFMAYLVSFGAFAVFIFVFYALAKVSVSYRRLNILAGGFFLVLAFLSGFVSLLAGGDGIYLVYFVYPLVVSICFVVFLSTRFGDLDRRRLINTVSAIAYILMAAGYAQQFKVLDLPGASETFGMFIRPSSLTGSFLHYPLVIVMFGAFLHALIGRLTFAALLSYLCAFTSFSRSGMMLVVIIASLFALRYILSSHFIVHSKSIVFASCVTLVLAVSVLQFEFTSFVVQRMFSAFEASGAGNSERIQAWGRGVSLFSETNFLLGEYFGRVTNLTSNLSAADTFVVESGLLQNLLNFGLLGTVSFYSLFLIMYFTSRARVMRYFVAAFFLQSFIYQSIEVLPFIIGALLFAAIARDQFLSTVKGNRWQSPRVRSMSRTRNMSAVEV